jgi:glucose-1-phosphate cytidylyltransferase
MKAVILAGGLGTRISEETHLRPKPMIEIGGRPILWHIMKIYSAYGINDFIICAGYKGYMIKEYFVNYSLHMSDITVDLRNNSSEFHQVRVEPWRVTILDTGDETLTGGRLLRARAFLEDDEPFCFTYGDGVGNINIKELIDFHRSHKKLATMTSTYPPGRFGAIETSGNQVRSFIEKPRGEGGLINAGFFVLDKQVLSYIEDDQTIWEQEPLKNLAADGQLMTHIHQEFWQPMDTLRDKSFLSELWDTGAAPWKIW